MIIQVDPMRSLLIILLISFLPIKLSGQIITIIDSEDNRPVPDVIIYNETGGLHIYSNRQGKADISVFPPDEPICFQHFSYERKCLTPSEINGLGKRVSMLRKVFDIQEFVVSASRWEQNRNEVPNKITTIPVPEIRFRNPQTAADLISATGEVFVQKSQLGGGSPMIRGFATNRVLIVIDGVRMNNAIYREGNIQNVISLDPNSLESTEVIFGPGAYIYGSDAIGGVMDFHTMNPVLSGHEKTQLRVNAFSRLSSASKEKTGHIDIRIGGKKLALLSAFSWSDYEDLKMGSGLYPEYLRPEYVARYNGKDSIFVNNDPEVQVFSGFSQINTTNKIRFRLSDKIDLVFSNHYSRLTDVPRYDRLIQYKSGKLRYAEWYYGPQIWMMNNLQTSISGNKRLFNNLKITAAQQNYQESRHDRSINKDDINEQLEKVIIYSLNLDFDKKLGGEDQYLFYGAEVVSNDITSAAQTRNIVTGSVIPAGSRYPNGTNNYFSFSSYAGYKNNFSEKITLNTGVRYNYVSLYSTIADNSYYNFPFDEIELANGAFTGSAGVVYRPSDKIQLNLNASTGFRAPNLDDAGKVFESAPGIVIVPNPGLEPEYAWNVDLGISKDFSGIVRFEVTGFFTWLENAMVRGDFLFNGQDSIIYQGEMSKVEAVVNTGYARVYGLSSAIEVNISKRLSLRSVINLTEGDEQGGIPLRHAAPLFGSTHLVYESPIIKADLYSEYNASRKYEDMPPSEIDKPYMYAKDADGNPWSPGWYTINFKISGEVAGWCTLNAGIENILDYRYRPYSSGIVSPGRNFLISLRIHI